MASPRLVLLGFGVTIGPLIVIAATSLVFGFTFGVGLLLVVVIAVEIVLGLGVEVAVLRRMGGMGPQRRSGLHRALEKGAASGFVILAVVLGRLVLSPPLPWLVVLLGVAVAVYTLLEEAARYLA